MQIFLVLQTFNLNKIKIEVRQSLVGLPLIHVSKCIDFHGHLP